MYEYWMKQAGYWMCSKYSEKCKRLHVQAYLKKALQAYMKENCT